MARRVFAVALALVVVGTPVAGDLCQVSCAEHALHPTTTALHHHHSADTAAAPSNHRHHHPDAESVKRSTSATIDAAAHSCRDLKSLVGESRIVVRADLARAVSTSPRVAVPRVDVSAWSDVASRHGPSLGVRSIAPLRI